MNIRKYFDNGYDYLVVPKAVDNVPIAMAKMMKDDGSYLTINGNEFGLFNALEIQSVPPYEAAM